MEKKLYKHLDKNLIDYHVINKGCVVIDGKMYQLFRPAYDGALFDEGFNFVGIPLEGNEDINDFDYYIYDFGGVYYYLKVGNEYNVKLTQCKYLGKALIQIPMGVFLGVHGQYEIMSGMNTYTDWCSKAKFLGIHTLGICERNTLAGTLKFQNECDKFGIKSVIGMECSVFDEKNDYRFTVKVYAVNSIGWKDLLTINKFINCDNPKYIGSHDFNSIVNDNDNLVTIIDPKALDYGRISSIGIKTILYQLDTCTYVDNERDKEYLLNLQKFYNDKSYIAVSLNDAWYIDEEYGCARQRVHSIGGTTSHKSYNQYFKSNDESFMEFSRIFKEDDFDFSLDEFSNAVYCLEEIASDLNFHIDVSRRHLPHYKMTPEEAEQFETNEDLFWSLIESGLKRHPHLIEKYGEEVIAERIDREVAVIKLGESIDYFLITRDIVNWCHSNNIMTGISRGSAGGALVSFLLAITKLDPMEYNLLFERFMNEGRVKVTLPDIDLDFPGESRGVIKKFMEERYGSHQVCSVGTYSSLQLRAALKDMSRLYNLEFKDVNEMMKMFDVKDRKPEDLFKIACANSRVKNFVLENSALINEALLLMPAPKAQSVHACAMMIFPDEYDMFHWVPIRKSGGEYVTEWEGSEMDSAGFLKEDILGVKQFDKFQDMVSLIKEHEDVDLDIFTVPLNDGEVYNYFQNGWNEDNFHFGSLGLTGYCKQMKPENIEDLIAAISLYRPGAMENNFHNDYISRKSGEKSLDYWVGSEQALGKTYGLIVYQEQVMELCRTLGGLSMVEADDVRKAMVKKKYEALQQYKERFIPNYCEQFGVDQKYSEDVWDAIDKASLYLFNRSHAAAYALTGYISQWIKVHYPIEYWSVAFKYAEEKDYPRYISEINKTGVCTVRSVDINLSHSGVYINFKERALYWSIMGVKQVAEKAASQIILERDSNGIYYSFEDFITRHKWKGSAVNSGVVKNLILAGAFDKIENIQNNKERAELICQYQESRGGKIIEDDLINSVLTHIDDDWWWTLIQKHISGLAFFDYGKLYDKYANAGVFSDAYSYATFEECLEDTPPNNGLVIVAGCVVSCDIKKTKRGDSMCRIMLENNYEFLDVVLFKNEFEALRTIISDCKNNILMISGSLTWDKRNEKNTLRANGETNLITLALK